MKPLKVVKHSVCKCGKKVKIHWEGKAEYQRCESPICVGVGECKGCGLIQQHFIGDPDAIKEFKEIMANMA